MKDYTIRVACDNLPTDFGFYWDKVFCQCHHIRDINAGTSRTRDGGHGAALNCMSPCQTTVENQKHRVMKQSDIQAGYQPMLL